MAKNIATIQVIDKLLPIEGADRIELATLRDVSWRSVVRKGAFQPGDVCVYVSIDSVLPEAEWTAPMTFLPPDKRIRSCRFKGVLSQGLILALQDVAKVLPSDYAIGQDVAEYLVITHYEKPAPVDSAAKGNFPAGVPKTDEIMLQSLPRMLECLRGQEIYVTVKCDGTSSTYSMCEGELDVCSRNWSYYDHEGSVYWAMAKKYGILAILTENDGLAIQAEVVGPSIQGNKMQLPDVQIRVFDVWLTKQGRYMDYTELVSFCEKYKLPMVPILEVTTMTPDKDISYWLAKANGYYENTSSLREGIVVRATKSQVIPALQNRASFKVINNEFLLKHKE